MARNWANTGFSSDVYNLLLVKYYYWPKIYGFWDRFYSFYFSNNSGNTFVLISYLKFVQFKLNFFLDLHMLLSPDWSVNYTERKLKKRL